jgi:hypothetical protein
MPYLPLCSRSGHDLLLSVCLRDHLLTMRKYPHRGGVCNQLPEWLLHEHISLVLGVKRAN